MGAPMAFIVEAAGGGGERQGGAHPGHRPHGGPDRPRRAPARACLPRLQGRRGRDALLLRQEVERERAARPRPYADTETYMESRCKPPTGPHGEQTNATGRADGEHGDSGTDIFFVLVTSEFEALVSQTVLDFS